MRKLADTFLASLRLLAYNQQTATCTLLHNFMENTPNTPNTPIENGGETPPKPPRDTIYPKSEQVQSIIDRMPTHHENTGG